MFYYLLLFFVGGTVNNLGTVVLGVVGLLRARNGKPYAWCFVVGLFFALVYWFGFFSGLVRNPEVWGTNLDAQVVYFVYFILFFSISLVKSRKWYRQKYTEASASDERECADKEA